MYTVFKHKWDIMCIALQSAFLQNEFLKKTKCDQLPVCLKSSVVPHSLTIKSEASQSLLQFGLCLLYCSQITELLFQ